MYIMSAVLCYVHITYTYLLAHRRLDRLPIVDAVMTNMYGGIYSVEARG